MAYAKLKLRHNQLKQRLQEDTRPSSTRRWRTIFVDIIFYANTLHLSTVFARFDYELLAFTLKLTHQTVAKRLRCSKVIPPGMVAHKGPHNHSLDKKVVHFCRERSASLSPYCSRSSYVCHRCEHCGYYCTLPLGRCN